MLKHDVVGEGRSGACVEFMLPFINPDLSTYRVMAIALSWGSRDLNLRLCGVSTSKIRMFFDQRRHRHQSLDECTRRTVSRYGDIPSQRQTKRPSALRNRMKAGARNVSPGSRVSAYASFISSSRRRGKLIDVGNSPNHEMRRFVRAQGSRNVKQARDGAVGRNACACILAVSWI